PLCNGQWFPLLNSPAGVQYIHRILAGFVFLWTVYLFIQIAKKLWRDKAMKRSAILSLILVTCQVIVGALVVLTKLNLIFLLLHAFFISCFFGTLCYMFMISLRISKDLTE